MRSREDAAELQNGIKGSALQAVGGTGNMIPMEAPRELAEIIIVWLANLFPDKNKGARPVSGERPHPSRTRAHTTERGVSRQLSSIRGVTCR